jgi:3-methylfumaryl-CoA hydratase
MWAGSRLEFRSPLLVGDPVTRNSRIASVKYKEGRTGPLVFVVVSHDISGPRGLAITEEHDIVYRGHPAPGEPISEPPRAPQAAAWERSIIPDDVLLFRYSALTFNGHRIHYDRRYVTGVENYPGLVVHGPLLATLLIDLLRRNQPEAEVKGFVFRAVSPVFDTAPFSVCGVPLNGGKAVHLWVRNQGGGLAMDATATC